MELILSAIVLFYVPVIVIGAIIDKLKGK